MICDFCGVKAKIYGKQVFSDRGCNFDICHKCCEKVPEKHHLVPLQNDIPKELDLNYDPD
jgi:protein-arginine kinase activator protein McsA